MKLFRKHANCRDTLFSFHYSTSYVALARHSYLPGRLGLTSAAAKKTGTFADYLLLKLTNFTLLQGVLFFYFLFLFYQSITAFFPGSILGSSLALAAVK